MQIGQVARDEHAVGSMDNGANVAVSEIENVDRFQEPDHPILIADVEKEWLASQQFREKSIIRKSFAPASSHAATGLRRAETFTSGKAG